MKTMILSCFAVAILVTGANAQMAIGPEGGINISNYVGFTHTELSNTRIYTGIRLGGVLQTPICGNFYIERGLFYVMNGYKQDVDGKNVTFRVNTAELPMSVQYKFRANPSGDRVFIGLGPYLAFNFSGRYKVSESDVNKAIVVGSDFNDNLKIVDFGVGANAGYQVANGIFIRAHLQMGMINLKPYGDDNNAMYNTNYGVTIGYLFVHECKYPEHDMKK